MKKVDKFKEIFNNAIYNSRDMLSRKFDGTDYLNVEDKSEVDKSEMDMNTDTVEGDEFDNIIDVNESDKTKARKDINDRLSELIQKKSEYEELDDLLEVTNEEKECIEMSKELDNTEISETDSSLRDARQEFDKTDTEVNGIEEEEFVLEGYNGTKGSCKDTKGEVDGRLDEDEGNIEGNTSEVDIDIRITMATTDSSLEDEEVKTILESCDELDKKRKERSKRMRKLRKPRKYEEIKMGRKRSKSIDNGHLHCGHNIDFTKYGISIGSGLPNDLLPGIEDYLSNVLANETLSEYAEEQRQYFLERLDIIKLPPSIPPRPHSLGVRLYPLHSSPPSSNRDSLPSVEQDDFAAYQRELSRALQGDTPTSPDVSEVKVYDDIDTTDGSLGEIKPTEVEDEESMYEIPQLQRTLSDSGYEKALELSPLSKSTSSEEQLSGQSGPPMPPPLPPRGERTGSDAASRSSIGSLLEERLSDTPVFRTKLNRESSVPARLENSADTRSEKSTDDFFDEEYDGESCDSLDELGTLTRGKDPDMRIQLPRPVKKKHIAHHRKLGKSLSSLWEITQPFGMLEDVVMSGELHYRSKLTWTRKIVALTNGRLVCYKVDKTDSRPSFVILLTGYTATFHKREGRRSNEIHLDHDNFESYVFLVDFKEWAIIWCEHINAAAKGQRAAGPVIHLARNSMMANQDGTYHMGNSYVHLSNSNASLVSADGFDTETGTVKTRKKDRSAQHYVVSGVHFYFSNQSGLKATKKPFAFKASQFFESFSKRSSIRKPTSVSSERSPSVERVRQSSGSQSSLGEVSEKLSPITPESHILESTFESPLEMKKHIKHQGYVDVYSSFNKRKWGKRWCLIHENNFECYRTQTSDVCELEFLLKNCILKRAIEETKSELGLMLLENNREKITIEPINWTELGSWLRILMQETSTKLTPEGLEGYMDDTHPYHEAVEITRVPDPVNRTSNLTVRPRGHSSPSLSEGQKTTILYSHNNRDSGICSSESNEDRLSSSDRTVISPTVHPCFTDSSLPRVSVCETGAIYTQVKRPSGTRSSVTTQESRNHCDRSKGSSKEDESNVFIDNDKVKACRNSDDETLFLDFEIDTFGHSANKRGSSLVDEIMSELKIQQDNNKPTDYSEEHNLTELTENIPDSYTSTKRKSVEFSPIENELSPIKSEDGTITERDFEFLCSSFVETDHEQVQSDSKHDSSGNTEDSSKNVSAKASQSYNSTPVSIKRHPSNVSAKIDITESLAELRTRLVQLKKDRISIRDRKQQISSERDKGFLEAEYERLNRECKKVTEEIKQLEQSENKKAEEIKQLEPSDNKDAEEMKKFEQLKDKDTDDQTMVKCDDCGLENDNIAVRDVVKQFDNIASDNNDSPGEAVVEQCCNRTLGEEDVLNEIVIRQFNDSNSNKKVLTSEDLINISPEATKDDKDILRQYSVEQIKDNLSRNNNGSNDILESFSSKNEVILSDSIVHQSSDTVPKQEEFHGKAIGMNNEDAKRNNIPDTDDKINIKHDDDLVFENNCISVSESVCDNENVPNLTQIVKEKKEANNDIED